ncbi:hypothetical protein SPV_2567 [Streptococcus pneumoniae]|nr:hypothetical protein SPV_2567 [Streptococcus pneumoniae]
MIDKGNKKF